MNSQTPKQWDVFISYASEDREAVAQALRPSPNPLQINNLHEWEDFPLSYSCSGFMHGGNDI